MQSQKPSSRTWAIISLVGAVCALLGSFLSSPGQPVKLVLLGFLLTVVGAFLSKIPSPTPEQKPVSPPFQPSRIGAILSLLGGALVTFGGIFFPMLITSEGIGNPDNIHYPMSQWLVLNALLHESLVALQVGAVLLVLPLLSA